MCMLKLITKETVLSYALGFVVAWFGVNEVFSPSDWVVFAPGFFGTGSLVLALVVIHGVILTSSALLLFFNYHRRIAAGVLALIFIEIITGLVFQSGLSDIAVRDIGLCGMAIAIALR